MRAYSTDANHKEIVEDLRRCGISVRDDAAVGGGKTDIITHFRATVMIEIKFGTRAEFKRGQLEFLANWKGFCGYARDFEEAKRLATEPEKYALSDKQKNQIVGWLIRHPAERVLVKTFEREAFGIE